MNKDLVVLVVEDNELDMCVITQALDKTDIIYKCVTSGEEALKVAKVLQPDIAILDINMPGLNGRELCRKLQEHEKTNQIKIIFLTASSSKEDILFGIKAQVNDYIEKGVPIEQLLLSIAGIEFGSKTKDEIDKFSAHNQSMLEKYEIISQAWH